jgi:phosphatidylinositol alpha-mannosyltransferase
VLDDGAAARLVPPGDPAALADAIVGLLDDPAARRSLAAAGARCVQRFDWGRVVADVEAVYDTVVAGSAFDEPRTGWPGRLAGLPNR